MGNQLTTEARIRVALAHVAGRPCLLCGGPADWAGVWVPSEMYEGVFKHPPGEQAFAYALCADCKAADVDDERSTAKLIERHGKREPRENDHLDPA